MSEQEYNRIVDTYADAVYKMAYSYTKSYHDTCDIVQNVFVKLYQKAPIFNDEQHIRNWLIRVAINECKNDWNSFWKKNISLENEDASFEKPTADAESNTTSQVRNAVMNLPKKYRITIHLFYYEGYPTKEIAAILKEKESTIRTRLVRARRLLKAELKDLWSDEEA